MIIARVSIEVGQTSHEEDNEGDMPQWVLHGRRSSGRVGLEVFIIYIAVTLLIR